MSSDFYGPSTTRSSGFDKGRDRDRDSRPDGREGGAGSRQQEREPKRQRGHGDDESNAGGLDVTVSSQPLAKVSVGRRWRPVGHSDSGSRYNRGTRTARVCARRCAID